MISFEDAVSAVQNHSAAFQSVLRSWPAYLGDGEGNVVGSQVNYYHCRYPTPESPAIEVYANGCPPNDGLRVMVGNTADQPNLIQIVSWNDSALDDTVNDHVKNHGEQHTYLGGDTVWVDWRQIMTFRVQPYAGLTVYVNGGVLPRSGADLQVIPQIVDLTDSVPGSSGQARYALLSIDTTGAIVITDGSIVTPIMALDASDVPNTPAGNFRVAAVALQYGQTLITESWLQRDILDLRWPPESITGTGVITPAMLANASAQYKYLVSGATPFVYAESAGALNIASGKTLTVSNSITLTGTDGGTTSLAVTSGKVLTLTAVDNFDVGFPASGTVAMLNQANSFTLINPLTTIAESWIGPSSTAGIYFKAGAVGLRTTSPSGVFQVANPNAAETPRQTIAGSFSSATGDYNVGFQFTSSATGTITALSARLADTASTTIRLYDNATGNIIASAAITGVANTWVTVSITPVPVYAGAAYVVAVRAATGNRTYTTTSVPVTQGSITINNTLYIAGSDAKPTTTSNTILYGVDITFSPGAELMALSATSGPVAMQWGKNIFTDNQYLIPFVNSTSTLLIRDKSYNPVMAVDTTNRRVGIGIELPTSQLHVYTNSDSGAVLEFQNPYVGSSAYAGMKLSSDSGSAYFYRASSIYGIANLRDNFVVQNQSASIVFFTANEALRITNAGLIGVNVVPSTLFHVKTSGDVSGVQAIETLEQSRTSGGSDGDGGSVLMAGKSSTDAAQSMGLLEWYWPATGGATHASRFSAVALSAYSTTNKRTGLTVKADSVASVTTIGAAQAGAYTTTAINLTLTTAHHWVKVTAACTITLPTAVGISGREYSITATANSVIVDGDTTETISGALTVTLNSGDSLQIKSDGANWFII